MEEWNRVHISVQEKGNMELIFTSLATIKVRIDVQATRTAEREYRA